MKVVVVGGGPCGILTSISIKKFHPEYEVILLEKDKDIGSRIKVSGNGRCNFFNSCLSEDKYSSKFVNHVLPLKDEVLELFDQVGYRYFFDEQGRGYPISESSSTFIYVLKTLLNKYQVKVMTSYLVSNIEKNEKNIIINNDIVCDRLVLAPGGISYQNDKLNYNRIVSNLCLKTTDLTPSLSPLSVSSFPKELENKRIKCLVKLLNNNKVVKEEKGEVLFKKDGLSGIVIFNMSSYLARKHLTSFKDYQISLDLLPEFSSEEIKNMIGLNPSLEHIFIKEIADYLIKFNNVANIIKDLRFSIRGLYEFKFSQVTSGGVALEELTTTYSLKKDPRIYLGGEFIDVDGECGGYNIAFALCSGYYIGKNIK